MQRANEREEKGEISITIVFSVYSDFMKKENFRRKGAVKEREFSRRTSG
jgi:hypothetical protein